MRLVKSHCLRRRIDYQQVRAYNTSVRTPYFVLTMAPQHPVQPNFRVGFTVSRKVGKAVMRNRVKRRLHAVAAQIIFDYARPGYDYVIIGRRSGAESAFKELTSQLIYAMEEIHNKEKATN